MTEQHTGLDTGERPISIPRPSRKDWWNLAPESDTGRLVSRGHPNTSTGNQLDTRLDQNLKVSQRNVDPLLAASKAQSSSSGGSSQSRRATSLSMAAEDKRQRHISRGKGHEANDSTIQPNWTSVNAIYNAGDVKDVTVHTELDLSHDLFDELETFNRLSRTGNFSSAREFFDSHLRSHVNDPIVFVPYAELLLEQGDFKSLVLLDGKDIFWEHGSETPEDSGHGICRLELNWKLIRSVALCHSQHTLSSVWEGIDGATPVVPGALGTSSTEVRPIKAWKYLSLANYNISTCSSKSFAWRLIYVS